MFNPLCKRAFIAMLFSQEYYLLQWMSVQRSICSSVGPKVMKGTVLHKDNTRHAFELLELT
ncbi:hypothetical protein SERLA73DRAFT_191314, partial [Serpula lacrymans var. lacrymans S7.3]